MSLAGKTALVTGAGRGIGAACAAALAREGARVVVVARTRAEIDAVVASLQLAGGAAFAINADVTDPASVTRAFEAAVAHFGPVDILVNNAGAASSAPIVRTTFDEWNRLFAVNATSAFLCTQAAFPSMIERKHGRVVNIASVAALRGDRYIAAYSAAKHAVLGLTRSAAAEGAPHGISVNAVCPGYADTEMTRESVRRIVAKTGLREDEALASILEHSSQRRLVTPEEVAHVVLMLCADGARSVNGEAITVDGGELRS